MKKIDYEKCAKEMNEERGNAFDERMLKVFLRTEGMYYNNVVIRVMKIVGIVYIKDGRYYFKEGVIHWTELSNMVIYYKNGNFINKKNWNR